MLTIGQLARMTEIPTSTLRYYERQGLLRADGRSEGNYRLYAPSSADRLRFIRAAQSTGLTLADIRILLAHWDGEAAPCREVRELLEQRLIRVEEKLSELRQFRKILQDFVASCREADEAETCHVMDKLAPHAARGDDRR